MIKTLLTLLFVSMSLIIPVYPQNSGLQAIVCKQILDGRSTKPLAAKVVLVKDGKISAIGDRSIIPKGATIIDLPDHTLMPGFIDMHCHPLGNGDDDYQTYHLKSSSAAKALQGLSNVQGLLRAGWTTIRI
ncbi:MAG: hypothetical protein RL161_55, partial [Bacteroidota bacterium]